LIDEGEAAPQTSIEVDSKSPTKIPKPVKKGTKRGSKEEKPRPNKRQKKEITPSDVSEEELSESPSSDESLMSDFEESDSSEAPKQQRLSKSKSKTPVKLGLKRKVSDDSEEDDLSEVGLSDDDEESDALSTPPKKLPPPRKGKNETNSKRQSKKSQVDSDEESEEGVVHDGVSSEEEPEAPKKSSPVKKPTPKDVQQEAETKANNSDSSEMSILLDPSPKLKQKRRSKSDMASGVSKPAKNPKDPKAAKPKPAKDLNPTEAEIKTLQSHLTKCGVRKIWGFELKQYGDDSKAKIRHLKGMLKEIGMDGRFSEQRAREIKELRELQADLEAVKEGDSKWGLESGRRNRGPRKSFKEASDEDDGEGSDAEGKSTRSRSTSETPNKLARARQELAFLGDDDESDSD
jgi:hypothetical protein